MALLRRRTNIKLTQTLTIGGVAASPRTNTLNIICGPDATVGSATTFGGDVATTSTASLAPVMPSGLSTDQPFLNCVLDGAGTLQVMQVTANAVNLAISFTGTQEDNKLITHRLVMLVAAALRFAIPSAFFERVHYPACALFKSTAASSIVVVMIY